VAAAKAKAPAAAKRKAHAAAAPAAKVAKVKVAKVAKVAKKQPAVTGPKVDPNLRESAQLTSQTCLPLDMGQ
jgi:hypothetical protein